MMRRRVSAVGLLLLVLLSACNNKGPTSRHPPLRCRLRPVEFAWTALGRRSIGAGGMNAVPGADQYIVEVGRSAGASDVVVETVTTTSRQLSSLPTGELFLRVKAKNSVGTGAASPDFTLTVPDLKDVIEALFLEPAGIPTIPITRSPIVSPAGSRVRPSACVVRVRSMPSRGKRSRRWSTRFRRRQKASCRLRSK